MGRNNADPSTVVSLGQGLYYLVTGIWPLIGIESFQRVSGRKTDLWLVKTVGSLIAAIGAALLLAAARKRVSPEIALLGVASATGLTAIDVVYVSKRKISPIYLLDALGELAAIAGWTWSRLPRPGGQ